MVAVDVRPRHACTMASKPSTRSVHGGASGDSGPTIAVFAYGSNLCVERIQARVSSARATFVARLEAHTLRFHKRGRDGSAKADAYRTGREADVVWGVVYEVSRDDKAVLDRIEGVGAGYLDDEVQVITADAARVAVRIYRAQADHLDPGLKPFTWYRDLVVRGAVQHGLPAQYREGIEQVPAITDPDAVREAREREVLMGDGRDAEDESDFSRSDENE